MSDGPLWEAGNAPSYPALSGDTHADTCVIGLGGSGLAAIHQLLDLGQRVVGVDAATVGGGAAGRNGGFLLAGLPAFYHDAVHQWGRDRVHAVYRRTMDEMDRMTEETPSAIRRPGSLRIADDATEVADCDEQLAAMRRDDLPAEAYDGPEGRGILVPNDGVFNPLLRCRLRAAAAIERGAVLHEQTRAVEILGDHVTTTGGVVRCQRVIVAVDGVLTQVLPELGARVRTARLQMLATSPDHTVHFPRPVYRRYGYEYWQQLPDGSIALGGLRDRSGEGEWTANATPTAAVQAGLEQVLRDQLHVTAPVTHRWAGVVGYSISGLPIVEEVRPSVWAIGGYNGTGNVLGSLCGRGIAELAVTGESALLAGLRTPA